MEGRLRTRNVALLGLVLAAIALGLGYWLYGLCGSKVQAQERDPTIGIDCVDFDYQAEAQEYLRDNPDDVDVLDRARDGIACETFEYDDNAERDETQVDVPESSTTTPSPSPSSSPFPNPSPAPKAPSPPAPKTSSPAPKTPSPASKTPMAAPEDSGTLMNAGGPKTGPVPMMPNGSCPREFPTVRDGACH